jgi:Protein of unknown function (DUF2844).
VKSLLALLAAVFFSCGSWAALGGAPARLQEHAVKATSGKVSTATGSYTVMQKELDSGTTVHEYLDSAGTVFAVSWSGPFLPDLKEILGPHFDTMAQAGKRRDQQRSRLAVRRSDVVIISDGRMGAFEGRAWVPAKVPAGFDVNAGTWPS